MTNEEALERIRKDYPEFLDLAERKMKLGESIIELLETLDSFL